MYQRTKLVGLKTQLVGNMGQLMKLSPSNESVRVTLPKEDLNELGLLDENGNLNGEHWAKIDRDGERFTLSFISP